MKDEYFIDIDGHDYLVDVIDYDPAISQDIESPPQHESVDIVVYEIDDDLVKHIVNDEDIIIKCADKIMDINEEDRNCDIFYDKIDMEKLDYGC